MHNFYLFGVFYSTLTVESFLSKKICAISALYSIHRFNATDFLERLRGKRLMLVGDSVNRNQFESMLLPSSRSTT